MRLFTYRRDRDEGQRDPLDDLGHRHPAFASGFVALPGGIGVGHLRDDDTVDLDDGRRVPRTSLSPAAAIPRPGKIVCIGLNYRDHIEEQHIETPKRPVLFAKFTNAVIADGDPIVIPEGTHALDLEVELGVVIGRRAHRVGRATASDHILGYVVVNDVTARDWQGNKAALAPGERGDGQWLRAKGSDTFLPMGPVLTLADEVPEPGRLRLRSWRIPSTGPHAGDNVLMQDGSTADMIFDVPAIIEFVSSAITLEPGDVIATGTPAGVGVFRDPPVFLQPGDRVRCEIERIGTVENPIVSWDAAATDGGVTAAANQGAHTLV